MFQTLDAVKKSKVVVTFIKKDKKNKIEIKFRNICTATTTTTKP